MVKGIISPNTKIRTLRARSHGFSVRSEIPNRSEFLPCLHELSVRAEFSISVRGGRSTLAGRMFITDFKIKFSPVGRKL